MKIALVFLTLMVVGCSSYDEVEIVKVNVGDKNVFLKKYYRGLNYEILAISLNSSKSSPEENAEYVSKSGRGFYYKVADKSLLIYDSDFRNQKIEFSVDVKFIELPAPELRKIEKDILQNEESQYSIFPPSDLKLLQQMYKTPF